MRVAINGMGRIGRLLFRRLIHHSAVEIVAVNDIMEGSNMAYLLRHDSVYGSLDYPDFSEGNLLVNGSSIICLRQPNPRHLPWKELDVDVVLECTGRFTSRELASQHLNAGARRVLLSTTGSNDIPLLIFGHNHHAADTNTTIISPGGCMTNCTTHLIYLFNSIGIESVQINVIHSYTSRQELVDAPHADFRRGRAAAESIIPVSVDLAQSLVRLFPLLEGKIAAVTTRVPVPNGALADFNFQLKQEVSATQINRIFKEAAEKTYRGIIGFTEEPLVSLDFKSDTRSAIIDGTMTSVVGRQVKVMTFFDNEYGYTSRMIDWLNHWSSF